MTHAPDRYGLCGVTLADKYRVDGVVGAGGFGIVYRGRHTAFDEPIAIKCLDVPRGISAAERGELMKRLADEGAVLHRLSKRCAAIVQALDVGEVAAPSGDWLPYLVLEWLEGRTLAQELASRRAHGDASRPIAEAARLLAPALRALALAHQQGVAHRDIKPENLFLTDSGDVKVLDFGIAKVVGAAAFTASPIATEQRRSPFTPSYGAPEQFNKRLGATGPWTDVFALALVLIELASGERALVGDDVTQLYVAATDPRERPGLRARGVAVSDAVEQVVLRALAIDPNDRWPDAQAFADALTQALPAAGPASTHLPTGRPAMNQDLSATGDFLARLHESDAPPAAQSTPVPALSPSQPPASIGVPPSSAPPSLLDPAFVAHYEMALIGLASEGVVLTVANVVARLGLPPHQAAALLQTLAQYGRLAAYPAGDGSLEYRVPGLTIAPLSQVKRELGPLRALAFRWLYIDPSIPPSLPPEAQKSVPAGVALGALVPFGLLYAAPLLTTWLVMFVSFVIVVLVDSIPVVGKQLSNVAVLLVMAWQGTLGGAYAWHYNRHGRRTALRALRYGR